ncbi:MAG TPA: lysophospholipid acyltransferase family protein [Candidatus Limnocylindrales bacterium]
MNPSSLPAPDPPGRLKRWFIRYATRLVFGTYLKVRYEYLAPLPEPPYVLNFNHPGWVDPFLLVGWWPRRHRIYVFGPKEEDMSVGWRNHVINWSHMAVPFKPSRSDLVDATKRAQGVIEAGFVLGIAGEGRLSDREGEIVPLQEGVAFFALRAQTPIVPIGIIGTRWVKLRKLVRVRVGKTIYLNGRKANRAGVDSLKAELTDAMNALLADAPQDPPPGRTGRWLTDLFADRPWLNEKKPEEPPTDTDDKPA